jgi:hypothetical protein
MSNIVVKEGDGLYKDGVKIKLEFGNVEQIEAIRKHEKKIIELTTEGITPQCSWSVKASAYFACLCGKNIFVEDIDADSDNDEVCFEGIQKTCSECKRTYEFAVDREYKLNGSGKRYTANETLKVILTGSNK